MAQSSIQNPSGVFEEALNAASDISGLYYDDDRLRRHLKPGTPLAPILTGMRGLMQTNGGIKTIASADPHLVASVESLHTQGLIAAVDGTDAISLTEYDGQSVYAAGVIGLTARTISNPRIRETSARLPVTAAGPLPVKDLLLLVKHLDRYSEDVSWCRTFREHEERREALRQIRQASARFVLIDGPLYTQNLLTQKIARDGILSDMLGQSDKLIGFIKEMRTAKLLHMAGMALQAGEYWVIDEWRQVLAARFDHAHHGGNEQTGAHSWLAALTQPHQQWVRVVYRKRERAFAFECHPSLVLTGIAMLHSAVVMSDAVNHELPFLLETADRIVRAQMAARAKSENLISDSPHYANLADEREFR